MDAEESVPLAQRMGIDRTCVDFSATLVPWQHCKRWSKESNFSRHRDCSLDYNAIEPTISYTGFSNQYMGVANFLAHASQNKNKYPNLCLKWFPNGRQLLGGSQGGKLIMWHGTTFQFEDIKRFPVGSGSVTAMQWSPDGDYLVAGDEHGKIVLLSPALSLLDAKLFEGLTTPVLDLSLSPNGSKLVSCADTCAPHVFDVQARALETTLVGEHVDVFGVTSVQWHPFKSLIISASKTNTMALWDPLSRRCIAGMHAHKAPITKVTWNPQGTCWLTASVDGIVKLWDLRKLRPLLDYNLSSTPTCMQWNPVFPKVFAIGDDSSRLLQFTSDFAQPLSVVKTSPINTPKETSILCMDWHPQGHILSTCSDDRLVRFWSRCPPGSETNVKWLATESILTPAYFEPFKLARLQYQSHVDHLVRQLPSVQCEGN